MALDTDAGLPIVPDCAQPNPQEPIRRGQFGSLDGALQNAEWMAKGEDLELKRRPAPKGGEKCGQESGQQVPEGESKEKDNSQFINQIGVCENHNLSRLRWTPDLLTLSNLGGEVPGAQRGGHGRADPYHRGSQLAGGSEATDLIRAAPVFQKSRDKQTRLEYTL